jgi:hypothetical protein
VPAADIPTKPRFPKVVKPQMRQNRWKYALRLTSGGLNCDA